MTDETIKSNTDNQDEHIKTVIEDWFKGSGFPARKITDTPIDDLQVVNKKYVDNQVSLVNIGSVFGRMFLSGAQTVSASSPNYEKVNYDSSSFSAGIGVDTSNNRFVTSVAGVFQVVGAVQYEQPNTSGTVCAAAIYINGSQKSTVWTQVAATNLNITPIISDIVNLNANDYVEIYTTKSFSDGLLQSGSAQTWATISKI